MTNEEIFNSLCDIAADLDTIADACYEKDCLSTQIELDWISQRVRDAIKIWQGEITK